MSSIQPVLQTFQLSKRFGELEAVQNVNLRLSPGEIVGLLGPNGAGKSTTIKMLSTLLQPTSGSAVLVGYDLIKNPFKIRQHIGIIFQDSTLDNRLTGRENLEFHCMIYKVPKQDRPGRIRQMLEMVDLTDAADRYVKTYSGGMKRRLEIARGLLHRPTILFLDEPTVGLDPQTRATIWEYVRRLVKEYGMGVLMTTHYMEEAENCRYIAIMDQGRLIAEGSPEQLKSMMEGDRIRLETSDNDAAASWLEHNRSVKVTVNQAGLEFVLPHGDTQLARILAELPTEVRRLSVQQPTLEDVFIQLTGRQIRDNESGLIDRLRFSAQRKGRL